MTEYDVYLIGEGLNQPDPIRFVGTVAERNPRKAKKKAARKITRDEYEELNLPRDPSMTEIRSFMRAYPKSYRS